MLSRSPRTRCDHVMTDQLDSMVLSQQIRSSNQGEQEVSISFRRQYDQVRPLLEEKQVDLGLIV